MIDDPAEYFHQFGSLHDAALIEMNWNARSASLRLEFDDYRASISEDDDRPRYSASVVFKGVSGLDGATNDARLVAGQMDTVSGLDVVRNPQGWQATLQMNSGAEMRWSFASLSVDERAA